MRKNNIDKSRRKVQEKLGVNLAGPFEKYIPQSAKRSFPPWVMIWAFIGQVLDPDQSCNQALARIQSHRLRLGLKSVSTDTGGYCKARQRLPVQLFKKLFQRTGQTLTRQAAEKDLWHDRRVKVVDGSHCSMPDTPANQKAFGQPPGQSPGCGFPTLAFVGVFCLATGAAIECALGGWALHDL
ncbi:MAG: transposase, partial [Planctomycetota bacterium]